MTENTENRRETMLMENYKAFQKKLPELGRYSGKYALIRDKEITGFYTTAIDANTAGEALYEDALFSIQKIGDQPANLGFFSYAGYRGEL